MRPLSLPSLSSSLPAATSTLVLLCTACFCLYPRPEYPLHCTASLSILSKCPFIPTLLCASCLSLKLEYPLQCTICLYLYLHPALTCCLPLPSPRLSSAPHASPSTFTPSALPVWRIEIRKADRLPAVLRPHSLPRCLPPFPFTPFASRLLFFEKSARKC